MQEDLTLYTSVSTLKSVHSALQKALDRGQMTRQKLQQQLHVQKLAQNAVYKAIYRKCKDLFTVKQGEALPQGLDPHSNTGESTFSLDQLVKMCGHLMKKADWRAARNLSMLLWQCLTCGRGDDVRERRFNEIQAPQRRDSTGQASSSVLFQPLNWLFCCA